MKKTWKRLPTKEEYKYIRNAHHYGVLKRIISAIFTIDDETVQAVILSKKYDDFVKQWEQPVKLKKTKGSIGEVQDDTADIDDRLFRELTELGF